MHIYMQYTNLYITTHCFKVLRGTDCFVRFLERNAPKKDSCTDLLLKILTRNSETEEKKDDISHLLVFLKSM